MIDASVLIICQNAERSLARTLDSVRQFAEVVVVDGGSSDRTAEIARRYPNVVYHYHPWPGFIAQRNYSLECATRRWCFMLDADEYCTAELAAYIEQTIALPAAAPMYRIMRTELFVGVPIEVGLGASGYQERLFQKSRIRYTGGNHHRHLLDGKLITAATLEVKNFPAHLRIIHDPDYGMEEWLKKLPRFVLLVAHEKIAQGRRVSAFEAFATFFLAFFKAYRKSWRGGRVSYLYCLLHGLNRALIKAYIYQYHKFPSFNQRIDSKKVEEESLG